VWVYIFVYICKWRMVERVLITEELGLSLHSFDPGCRERHPSSYKVGGDGGVGGGGWGAGGWAGLINIFSKISTMQNIMMHQCLGPNQ
jgi:hypothetical protein